MNEETALVEEARRGDRGAFCRLVEAHWDRLVRLCRSVVGEGEAEDVVQDGLLVAWRKLPELVQAGAFPAWLTRLVVRRAIARGRRRPTLVPLAAVPEPAVPADPGAGVDVARLLAALAPRQRAVMHLTVVEGLSDREIGGLLSITPASVRSHRRRARQRLAALMSPAAAGRQGGDDGR